MSKESDEKQNRRKIKIVQCEKTTHHITGLLDTRASIMIIIIIAIIIIIIIKGD